MFIVNDKYHAVTTLLLTSSLHHC